MKNNKPDNYNIEIVGIEQNAPFIYTVTISVYTDVGYQLNVYNSGTVMLGDVTYEGNKYRGMELIVNQDSRAGKPTTQNEFNLVERPPGSDSVGVYVKCGTQIETIKWP